MRRTLTTERLVLKPLSDDNREDVVRLNGDAKVMKYLTGEGQSREEAEGEFQEWMTKADDVAGLGVWAGYASQEFVGVWMMTPDRDSRTSAQIGYRLEARYWRQGLAKEGVKELVRYAFEDLKLDSIWGTTMVVNQASRATMESCGMQVERVVHEVFEDPLPGTEEGEVEYRLQRHEQFITE